MARDEIALELVIQSQTGSTREFGLRFTEETSVAALLERLGPLLEAPPGSALYLLRARRWLSPDEALGAIPVMRGDTLWIGDPGSVPPTEPAGSSDLELVVTGGPSMGARFPLTEDASVGRGRDCDVTIDDAAMSRTHLRIELDDAGVRVSDAGSTNGTYIDGVPLEPGHLWAPGELIEAGASLLSVEQAVPHRRTAPSPGGTIQFNRPPRVRTAPPPTSFDVPAPPQDMDRPRLPLIAAGVPLVLALILWQVFPGNPAFLVLLTLSPLIAVFSYLDDRRRGARASRSGEAEWRRSIETMASEMGAARNAAATRAREECPGATELERRALEVAPSLWQRRPHDPDFLTVRTGWGDRRWNVELRQQPGGSASLRQELDERLTPLRKLPSVPLTLSLRDAAVVGVTGDEPAVADAARWWVVQLAVLHSPDDVAIVVIAAAGDNSWSWTRWLPHCTLTAGLPAREVLDRMADEAERAETSGRAERMTVLFIDERAGVTRSTVGSILRNAKASAVHVVWLGSGAENLPGESELVVEVASDPAEAVVTRTEDGEQERGTAEGMDAAAARRIALGLAPIVDASAKGQGADLPTAITLFDMFESAPSPELLESSWRQPRPGLSAPIGADSEGAFTLDLVSDGPHALIGGMTGAGKSELLQTFVASLAAAYPPTRLNFLMIDYKGGAAFAGCVGLPHTVGFVTDLDPATARRALVSLNAEVRRRETELRARGVADIAELERTAQVDTLPRLVIAIDEFATLVKELPGFVDGIVDIAQRGRSLGLHLVLATQRPAGVINDAIRANADLRISLRVADEGDSIDVIGIADAAHIPRSLPGRAYVRSGNVGLTQVQIARASAPALSEREALRIWDLNAGDSGGDGGDPDGAMSQLSSLVDAARDAGAQWPPQRSPWLPLLPELVTLDEVRSRAPLSVIGLLDEPHLQRQEPLGIDLDRDGGLIVYGTGRSGKTTLLTTVAASLAATTTSDALHIYGLDMTSGAMNVLEALPHCGDVVAGGDTERVRRLLFMLLREIDRRKTDGDAPRPKIVVLIDGYPAFTSAFERIDLGELVDLVPRLVADGRAVGIHFVLSAERRAGVPTAVSSLLPMKVVLRSGDEDDYAAFGLQPREVREMTLPPGRGFIDGTLFQAAAVSADFSVEGIRSVLEKIGEGASGTERPARVQGLPSSLALDELPAAGEPWSATFGLRETDLGAATADLRHGHFLVAGPYRSGRSTALVAIAAGLQRAMPEAELHLMSPRKSALQRAHVWASVIAGGDISVDVVEQLSALGSAAPAVVFIDDADDVPESVSGALEALVKEGRDGRLRIVAAAESRAAHRSFGGWLAEVKKDKQGLLLAPDPDLDGDLLGVRLPRRSVRFPGGRGYLVVRGEIELIQVALL